MVRSRDGYLELQNDYEKKEKKPSTRIKRGSAGAPYLEKRELTLLSGLGEGWELAGGGRGEGRVFRRKMGTASREGGKNESGGKRRRRRPAIA